MIAIYSGALWIISSLSEGDRQCRYPFLNCLADFSPTKPSPPLKIKLTSDSLNDKEKCFREAFNTWI